MRPDDRHILLSTLFRTAIEAVHPRHLIPQTVTIEKDQLIVRPRDKEETYPAFLSDWRVRFLFVPRERRGGFLVSMIGQYGESQ